MRKLTPGTHASDFCGRGGGGKFDLKIKKILGECHKCKNCAIIMILKHQVKLIKD